MKKILLLVSALLQFYYVNAENWTSFRGPTGMGVTEQKIPTSWNNGSILWEKSIAGEGQSSVVEAGNKIFLTASENSGNKRSLLCFTKDKGKLLWQKKCQLQRRREQSQDERMVYANSCNRRKSGCSFLWSSWHALL